MLDLGDLVDVFQGYLADDILPRVLRSAQPVLPVLNACGLQEQPRCIGSA